MSPHFFPPSLPNFVTHSKHPRYPVTWLSSVKPALRPDLVSHSPAVPVGRLSAKSIHPRHPGVPGDEYDQGRLAEDARHVCSASVLETDWVTVG